MLYAVLESFGPFEGDKWQRYLEWRGLPLECFDSICGILRPSLFVPKTEEEWGNCVNEDFMTKFLTNFDYALSTKLKFEKSVLVGVELAMDAKYIAEKHLIGFDIIDHHQDVSMLTNWRAEDKFMDEFISSNGLILDLSRAIQIRDYLQWTFPEDDHAQGCCVWAVYGLT